MTAVEIVGTGKKYSRGELQKLISGHLFRCTGYENILNAMECIVEDTYRVVGNSSRKLRMFIENKGAFLAFLGFESMHYRFL